MPHLAEPSRRVTHAAVSRARLFPGIQGRGGAAIAMRTDVDLLHVMRGILFPAAQE